MPMCVKKLIKSWLVKQALIARALLGILLIVCITNNGTGQKTVVEYGPFEPYGGMRKVTYDQQNTPLELKEYDILRNLRRQVSASYDSLNRLTRMTEHRYNEHHTLVGGYRKTVVYHSSLDYNGKTSYQQFDAASKAWKQTPPLLRSYEQSMVTAPPDSLQMHSFYKKYTDALGIPVVSSAKTANAALLVARDIVNSMLLNRPDIRACLVHRKSKVLIMSETEMETDLPEHSNWKKPTPDDPRLTPDERSGYYQPGGIFSLSDKQYWNQRARGMGGYEVSCAEENLLGFAGTKYFGENILVHEFSHTIMSAVATVDSALYRAIVAAYAAAKKANKYAGQYAINTVEEYWAEGSQWWFGTNDAFRDGDHLIQSKEDLKKYDPDLYDVLKQVYMTEPITADVYHR